MKRRKYGRVLSIILAVCMLLGTLPADMLGGIASVSATESTGSASGNDATVSGNDNRITLRSNPKSNASGTYMLDADDVPTFAGGTKADGDEVTVGNFTLICSTKAKVEEGRTDGTFEDGFSAAKRINFGGGASVEKNSIKFTTNAKAEVTIYWIGGKTEDKRQMAILNEAGEVVTKTAVTVTKDKQYITTLTLDEAGTYYLGTASSNNYIFGVKVAEEVKEKVQTKSYVLDADDVPTFAAGTKTDGEEVAVGNFTLVCSTKAKVEEGRTDGTFEDGFSATKRINFGGGASVEKNSIKFTTNAKAEVTIYWIGGKTEDKRQMAILNEAGEVVTKTAVTVTKDKQYITTLTLDEAGTYYLGTASSNNYIFGVKVVENVKAQTYVLDADDVPTFAAGAKTDGEEVAVGNFTLVCSAKAKVEDGRTDGTFEDGFNATKRINFGGGASVEKNSIKFTTNMKAEVTIYWIGGKTEDKRQMAILNEAGEVVTKTAVTVTKDKQYITTLTLDEAGTYYLGTASSNNYIFGVKVAEQSGESVKKPVVTAATATIDDGKVTIAIVGTVGDASSSYVVEASKDGNTWIKAGTADGTKTSAEITVDLTGEKFGSGTWSFKVYGKGDDVQEPAVIATPDITYTLPLATPEVTVEPGDSKATVKWGEVREAEKYNVAIYTVENGGTAVASVKDVVETSAEFTGLTNNAKYYAEVIAVRGSENKVSERVVFWPYIAVDTDNAIPGMEIVDQEAALALTILRDGSEFAAVQSATEGGVNSTGRTNVSFAKSKEVASGDFSISVDVLVNSTASGTGRGIFVGAVSDTTEAGHWFTTGLRGDNSVRAYMDTFNGGSGSAKTIDESLKWETGKTYTLAVTREGDTLTSSITADGITYEYAKTKSEDAIEAALWGDVYPVIAVCGANVELSNLVVNIAGTTTVESDKWTDEFTPFADNWATVDAPTLEAPVVDNAKQEIKIVVNGEIGVTGAASIDVQMIDENGEVVATETASTLGTNTNELTFEPTASGVYTFMAIGKRPGESVEKESATVTASEKFILKLTGTTVSAFSRVGGAVKVNWTEVVEATGYNVYYKVKGATDYTLAHGDVSATSVIVTGLTVGETYNFMVKAVRDGEEATVESTVDKLVEGEFEREWFFSAFGSGVDEDYNNYSGGIDTNDLKVWSTDGKGKIVPNSTDGLAFYYTTIDPENENFTLTADVIVDEWKYSNGQEGFGMMAADAVGEHDDSSTFWNNSYMLSATKVEYKWDPELKAVSDEGTKYTMRLGVGAQEKTGVTAENLEDMISGDAVDQFVSRMATLENAVPLSQGDELLGGDFNRVANCTNGKYTNVDLQTTFKMTIQRNNTGYILSYTDENGVTNSKTYYHDPEGGDALTKLDSDNIYVGFYASRNAKISVKNVQLTTINPADDEAAAERPIEYVPVVANFESANFSTTGGYELVYYGNADGTLTITSTNSEEPIAENIEVKAEQKYRFKVSLSEKGTDFDGIFTPDPNYAPSKYERLDNYGNTYFSLHVEYTPSKRNIYYVSPDGGDWGTGSKENPMDLYTAVASVDAGDYILLMEGNYDYYNTVTIQRGINGTADNMIYLIADPEATSRPVIDFNRSCAGIVLAGDYWYFQGFDVTNSSAGQKGIQVSGDNNILDRLYTYRNGNTGIQISRFKGTDTYEDWPSNNLVLNCTSYLNADPGYEDADGFAAKLTVADGNVFDGCIAAYNADDGWDLYAKVESGSIGVVTIKNSIAFKNGFDIAADGSEIIAGNGNGFKMGGESMDGAHVLENSIAFANRAKGIDSNSGPNIKVYNSTSFDNASYNVAFYTNNAKNTDYYAEGIISYNKNSTEGENIKLKGTQDKTAVYGESNYYESGSKSTNSKKVQVEDSWFVSLDTDAAIHGGITRNADGTINMNGYLELTDAAPANAGATLDETTGTASAVIVIDPDKIAEDEADDEDDEDDEEASDSSDSSSESTGSGSTGNAGAGSSTGSTGNAGSSTGSNAGGKTEGGKTEGGKTEGGKTEGGKTEDGKTEGGKTEDGKTEGGKTEDGKTEGGKTEGDKKEDGKTESSSEGNNAGASAPADSDEVEGGSNALPIILGVLGAVAVAGIIFLIILKRKDKEEEE
ncbi:MAG: fibronectin type III domain-containing protein [Lachnospiraceae bacterium]|nr:fibronectin type III domain-containing protein [Lachnospiraceae bacterium]